MHFPREEDDKLVMTNRLESFVFREAWHRSLQTKAKGHLISNARRSRPKSSPNEEVRISNPFDCSQRDEAKKKFSRSDVMTCKADG